MSRRLRAEDIMPGLVGGEETGQRITRRISVRTRAKPKVKAKVVDKTNPKFWAKQEAGLARVLDRMLKEENRTSIDTWNIDDRDLPVFPNFYEFCLSKSGLYSPLHARQMWLAVHLLAEWCPKCSPKRKAFRHIKKIPVGFDVRDLPDKIVMLEYGRCPSCGVTKGQLIQKGLLNPYGELCLLYTSPSPRDS